MNTKLFIIVLFLFMGCAPIEQAGALIDTACDLCIVEGKINGKKTYFLIDTGSGLTTLDIHQSKHFEFTYADTNLQIGGLLNHSGPVKKAIGIRSIEIDNVDVTGDLTYTTAMGHLVKHVQECSYKTISGIIGVPIIKKHGLVIDLTNNKLYRNHTH